MNEFAIYDRKTGEVLKVGSGSSPAVIALAKKRKPKGASVYLGAINPATHYLPGGKVTAKPEAAPEVKPAEVKQWAAKLLSYTDWMAVRSIDGAPIPEPVAQYRQAIRDRSGEIEAMEPIPTDYRDAKWWPEKP